MRTIDSHYRSGRWRRAPSTMLLAKVDAAAVQVLPPSRPRPTRARRRRRSFTLQIGRINYRFCRFSECKLITPAERALKRNQ